MDLVFEALGTLMQFVGIAVLIACFIFCCVWTMFTIGLALLSIRLWPLVLVGLLVYGIVSCKLWRK